MPAATRSDLNFYFSHFYSTFLQEALSTVSYVDAYKVQTMTLFFGLYSVLHSKLVTPPFLGDNTQAFVVYGRRKKIFANRNTLDPLANDIRTMWDYLYLDASNPMSNSCTPP